MSNRVIVQYLGFRAKPLEREYAFQVRGEGTEREFTLDIPNEAFLSHRVKYQDAPAICSQRLQAELTAHANDPLETHFVITLAELDAFRASRVEKSSTYTLSRS
jgi:hypothetical protein